MEKYSFEKAENESVRIRELAEINKKRRANADKNSEPTKDDYKTADGWMEDEKEEAEAEITLKNLKNIDLSTTEGRIDVVQMYNVLRNAPRYEGPKDESGHDGWPLKEAIKQSAISRGGAKGKIPVITKENILKDLKDISDFYGHCLVKIPENLRAFMMGREHSFKNHSEIKDEKSEEANKFLLSYILNSAGQLSSDILNAYTAKHFLSSLYRKIKSEEITEEKAKTHPNYMLAEELALKADMQQKVLSDILFKILSSYIHTNDFSVPSLNLNMKMKELIFVKNEEINGIDLKHQISKTLTRDMIQNSVDSFSFNLELEAEIKELMEYVNFYQPILEKYNAMLKYHGHETENK